MKYCKKPLSFEDQADLLIRRGLLANKKILVERLKSVNYYRLSAYWHPFRNPESESDKTYFIKDTSLEMVWNRYVFDRKFRLAVMDAVERVEIAIRTKATYEHVIRFGPFGYLKKESLPSISDEHYAFFLKKIHKELYRKDEDFIDHYLDKYEKETEFPLWMACEVLSFGGTLTFFQNLPLDMKRKIANEFNVDLSVLESWLITLNFIRNICAHHKRLWNRNIESKKPKIPRKNMVWHDPVAIPSNCMFGVLTILN